jgi:PKD repeat protein
MKKAMNKVKNFVDEMIVRRTVTVLLAFGLMVGLLSGCTGVHDQSAKSPVYDKQSSGTIVPLDSPVLAGEPVMFSLNGNLTDAFWELGDGATAEGLSVHHTYQKPGVYRVVLGSKAGGTFNELTSAIVRVHTPETLHLPQVLFDTDAANEIDDQHAIAYAVFSELDILAITSSGWINWVDADQTRLDPTWDSEDSSYIEILKVLDLAQQSGLPKARVPMVFRGAKHPLRSVGLTSDRWFDTEPVITEASNAILAVARGASPDNPVWVLPVGPTTNIASALLQVRQEGWEAEFSERIRICWLGGTPDGASTRANGGRDPWAPWVTYMCTVESGTEFVMFLERPTGFSINFDPDTDVALYPDNPLGDYLKMRTLHYVNSSESVPPGTFKGMYDLGVLSYVISEHLNKPWIMKVTPSILLPHSPYKPQSTTGSTNLAVVHEINVAAVKKDFWDTMNGNPTPLPPKQ